MTSRLVAVSCLLLAVVAIHAQAPPPQPSGNGLIVGQVVDASTGRGLADAAVTPVLTKDVPPDGSPGSNRAVLSDREGRFVIRGLPPGDYMVAANRAGYVKGFYGVPTGSFDGKPVAIADGGRFGDARIELTKFGVIAGTVLDDAGDPIVGIQVRAFKRNLIAGRWKFGEYYSRIKYNARTDDRGMYRISDVEPGEYVVCVPLTSNVAPATAIAEFQSLQAASDPASRAAYAAARDTFNIGSGQNLPMSAGGPGTIRIGDVIQTLMSPSLAPVASPTGPWLVYQTQFYPSGNVPSGAQALAMKAGEERSGIDFQLRPVRTWRVSGVVTGLPSNQAVALRLIQADAEPLLDDTLVAATLSSPDGAFTFVGVPAGRYDIKILRIPTLPRVSTEIGSVTRIEQAQGVSGDPTFWASVPVTVGAGDMNGVTVAISTGTRARGRIVFEGSSPKPTPAEMGGFEITLEQANGREPQVFQSDRIRLAGETFETPELAPGKYLLSVYSRGKWSLKTATAGSLPISDVPLVVDGRELPPITVTFTDRPLASIQGSVRDGGAPARDAFICVFPVERELWMDYGTASRRMRRAQPDQSGAFRTLGFPPGDYYIVAVQGDRQREWRDPKFLEALSRIATKITLAGEEPKTMDLTAQKAPAVSAPAEAEPEIDASCGPCADASETDQQAPQTVRMTAPEPVGSGKIIGVLTTDSTNPAPIRRAVVVVISSAEPKVARSTITDDAGHFVFSSLPAARYSLTAQKAGYLDARFGATKPGRPGTAIVLGDGATSTADLKMTRTAVITGTVRDERGDPVRGVSVSLNRYEMVGGERRLSSAGRTQQPTDDRGQYRLYDVEPGEYFASVDYANIGYYRTLRQTTDDDLALAQRELRGSAVPSATSPTPPPEMGYAPVFHPGTLRLSEAAAIKVAAGEERTAVDITLRLIALAHLKAYVLGPDGQPPAMVQASLNPTIAMPGMSPIELRAGIFEPVRGGLVQINGIQPGEYTLEVGGSTVAPPPSMQGSGGAFGLAGGSAVGLPMWAMMPITIDGRDVDLTVQLQLGKRMTGRVVFEGATPPPASVSVSLSGPRSGGVTLQRRGTATPEFSIDGIVPNAYRVIVSQRGWTLKSAMINGQDAADRPVEISTDIGDVVVTFTDRLTEVSGVLQTAEGKPATDYFVIVFPKDPSYWLNGSRRIVGLRPATDGRFVTSATSPLPAGEYLIAAVTDVTNGQWFDPEFLKALVPAAAPLTLAEGEKKRQDLRIK